MTVALRCEKAAIHHKVYPWAKRLPWIVRRLLHLDVDEYVSFRCNPRTCVERVDCAVCYRPACLAHYVGEEPVFAYCYGATTHFNCHEENCQDLSECFAPELD